ncbi:MAG: DUF2577 domain-containing protein [Symbiobacteriaceae bacterium]|nr:DUF2577 domain-containing protein [Symbiobacteriaceae bacterium]
MLESIQRVIQNTLTAWGLTELEIGTVVSIDPLSIQIAENDILPAAALLLSDAVLPKEIDLRHRHTLDPHGHDLMLATQMDAAETHQHGISGRTEPEGPLGYEGSAATISEELGDRRFRECYRDGGDTWLPNEDGVILVQRALIAGDKVALLAVRRRQQYVVLFRLREVTP